MDLRRSVPADLFGELPREFAANGSICGLADEARGHSGGTGSAELMDTPPAIVIDGDTQTLVKY